MISFECHIHYCNHENKLMMLLSYLTVFNFILCRGKGCFSAFHNHYIMIFIEAISHAALHCVITQRRSTSAYDSNPDDCWCSLVPWKSPNELVFIFELMRIQHDEIPHVCYVASLVPPEIEIAIMLTSITIHSIQQNIKNQIRVIFL